MPLRCGRAGRGRQEDVRGLKACGGAKEPLDLDLLQQRDARSCLR